MDPPSSLLPDAAEASQEAIAITDVDATETKSEIEDGATTTSTQPENSIASSSTNGDGSDTNSPAAAGTTPETVVSPAPPQDTKSSLLLPSQPKTFVHDPNKITLKFIFANRDGLHVILDCTPADTVGEVKGALLSLWPDDIPECSDGDRVRLICMGKGILMPDSKSLKSLGIPVFKTHATPVNVAVRPVITEFKVKSPSKKNSGASSPSRGGGSNPDIAAGGSEVSSGCSCVIL
mmetsp:Transcript_19631/g.27956  ORF Transcript_19631/g.27956 Transcript_19631/m.27956 type:complete len:235 (+) Transcript_19631:262-966(+)|eukprot:CAMPEP_0201696728 /NCGR_PEP_ID=MMETSP0578-20130828/8301_1 /ASSEMBLY_ACC=CAM_ASM_000663 /TAXON_ID=267565 /ORGANISM="Skeletonema grethea, Strain CCMP 1804" /LENGTH=234 /DNA_ID=CAMNT_0048182757 /DNA_START=218 /DNA_END=922 /DNA_ORIENTATION=-